MFVGDVIEFSFDGVNYRAGLVIAQTTGSETIKVRSIKGVEFVPVTQVRRVIYTQARKS